MVETFVKSPVIFVAVNPLPVAANAPDQVPVVAKGEPPLTMVNARVFPTRAAGAISASVMAKAGISEEMSSTAGMREFFMSASEAITGNDELTTGKAVVTSICRLTLGAKFLGSGVK